MPRTSPALTVADRRPPASEPDGPAAPSGTKPSLRTAVTLAVLAALVALAILAARPIRGAREDLAAMRRTTASQLAVTEGQLALLREQTSLTSGLAALQRELLDISRATSLTAEALDTKTGELLILARKMLAELEKINAKLSVLPGSPNS